MNTVTMTLDAVVVSSGWFVWGVSNIIWSMVRCGSIL
jgi:hypothetical protein